MSRTINGIELHDVFTAGYRNLKHNMGVVNDLNVFPVPDGDTGTNMVYTFGGIKSVKPQENVGKYMEELSRAVLLCARGNSGVIFSQFIRGVGRGFEGKEKVAFADFKEAFKTAKEDAYNSIITPTEGTILTVISDAAGFLESHADDYDDLYEGFGALVTVMKESLARTPELLPVLKEAGVVDSGGAGLVCFFEGIHARLGGASIEDIEEIDFSASTSSLMGSFGPDSEMEYGYCTEFILQLMNSKTNIAEFSRDEFVKPLEALGDSIVAVHNDSIVKIHIHSFTPEKVLEYARNFGEFLTLKIENMSVQHSETQMEEKKEKVKYLIVAVASGSGLVDYFYSIGATAVIDGGQTNNPSVEDFINVFKNYEAEHIVVLPNNSNIIFAANQAAELYKGADVRVIPTKSIVEGYSALSMMNLWCDTVEELIEDMTSCIGDVITGYVTTATRDTVMDGVEVKKDKFIGIKNKQIMLCSDNRRELALELIDKVNEEAPKDVMILFSGADVPAIEAQEIRDELISRYPMADIGLVEGGFEVYDYIISFE